MLVSALRIQRLNPICFCHEQRHIPEAGGVLLNPILAYVCLWTLCVMSLVSCTFLVEYTRGVSQDPDFNSTADSPRVVSG